MTSIAMRDAVLRALLPYLSDAKAGRAALRVCEAIAPYLAASQADEMLDSIVATGGKVKVKFPKGTCQ